MDAWGEDIKNKTMQYDSAKFPFNFKGMTYLRKGERGSVHLIYQKYVEELHDPLDAIQANNDNSYV